MSNLKSTSRTKGKSCTHVDLCLVSTPCKLQVMCLTGNVKMECEKPPHSYWNCRPEKNSCTFCCSRILKCPDSLCVTSMCQSVHYREIDPEFATYWEKTWCCVYGPVNTQNNRHRSSEMVWFIRQIPFIRSYSMRARNCIEVTENIPDSMQNIFSTFSNVDR